MFLGYVCGCHGILRIKSKSLPSQLKREFATDSLRFASHIFSRMPWAQICFSSFIFFPLCTWAGFPVVEQGQDSSQAICSSEPSAGSLYGEREFAMQIWEKEIQPCRHAPKARAKKQLRWLLVTVTPRRAFGTKNKQDQIHLRYGK